ncbi:MAG: aspartate--ammonia ligase [Bacteroidales bacterium]|nr:aspartate--ammonia ligase [Bacteroidales bacterium]
MNREQTEEKIKWIKDTFERRLSYELNLLRVSGPMIVPQNGINDDLGGLHSVTFGTEAGEIEIVQSLAKWKRMRLKDFDTSKFTGIYVDMNAIRPHEKADRLHSYYVDQWDWELIISRENRNRFYLENVVKTIHKIINSYLDKDRKYPAEPLFIDSEELYYKYPGLTPKEREYNIVKEYGAVFIEQIGKTLPDGTIHDSRADDYDDWNLNGDLLYWYDPIQSPMEISSMGIRVDASSLNYQLSVTGRTDKLGNEYHKLISDNLLPQTIGGGIGQSRLCMLIMGTEHIGQVQASVWPEREIRWCEERGIQLL